METTKQFDDKDAYKKNIHKCYDGESKGGYKLQELREIATKLNLQENDLRPYGHHMAKIDMKSIDKLPSKKSKLIIEGVNSSTGLKFRPQDWADRMSGSLATFRNRRIIYSPLLRPAVNKSGNKCVIVDDELKETNPSLYKNLLDKIETRNIMFKLNRKNVDVLEEAVEAALSFESLWLRTKSSYYKTIGNSYLNRAGVLDERR